MKYLNDITEERLKSGWKYTFSNNHIINKGSNDELTEMYAYYCSDSMGVWVLIDDNIHFSHCFQTTLENIKKYSKKHNLELRAMKRPAR